MDDNVPNKARMPPRHIRRSGYEAYFPAVPDDVSLDEMLSLACRQGKQDIVELLLESGANVNHRNKAGNTPLLEACSQGHINAARMLLDRGADLDTPTEITLDSALTWACTLGNERVVELLLSWNTDVEHRTKDGCTALMFASLAGHVEVARMLLDHKSEINVESDSNKDSPLTFACWKGHQDVVELLLERKANIEHRTKEGFTPLMFAALGGHKEVAFSLLKHGAQVNTPSGSNNDIPLTSACWKGHCGVVKLLLEHQSNIEHRTKDGCTPLMLAAREGHLRVAKLLLENNSDVNVPSGSESNIPITLACWKGHKGVVDLLLQYNSNLEHRNKAGCTPLMLAAREGHYDATKLLLEHGALVNVPSGSNDDTPLTLACWKGHEDIVLLLIEHGSDLNHQTKTGCTPLMEATREGYVDVVRILLEAGSDVETPDNYGQSPLFMACWKGHAKVAGLLLEYSANRDSRTKTGITPLFQACRENNIDVVRLLIEYGCNINVPFPNSRECPLTLCAERGYFELIVLLLERGCNADCRTKRGCTPFFLACKEGHQKVSQLLLEHSADPEAAEAKNITPLVATFKNGHYEVVEWLLRYTNHLPSDTECQKCLLAPAPDDTDEESRTNLLHNRTKCLELIMKAKKTKEEAAQINAQILFAELDAEKEKRESKKNKRKEKRKRKHEKKMAQAMSVSVGHKEIDNHEALSSSLKLAEATYPQQDEGVALVSLSSSAEIDEELDKKEQRRAAGGDSSSTSSSGLSSAGSTRCSTRGSDVASQPDDDEEELFEDANSFPLDDADDYHSCQTTMPMYVKTVANSTLPEEAQVSSENTSKRHDKPAINSQSSSRTSSVSSDIAAVNNGPPWQNCSKNRGSLSCKLDKKTLLSSVSSISQRSDNNSSRTSCTDRGSLPDVSSLSLEPSRIASTVKTSASASNNCKHTTTSSWSVHKSSTCNSSTAQDRRPGESSKIGHHMAETGMASIVSRHPPAALDTVDNVDDSVVNKQQVTSTLQRRISAPVLCSRPLSGAINYAASVKANLHPAMEQQQQQKQLTLHSQSLSSLSHTNTVPSTTTSNVTSTSSITVCNSYSSRTSTSVAKPVQDVTTPTESQHGNLVAAADSVRLILQDLDSTVERTGTDEQQSTEHLTVMPDQQKTEGDKDIDNGSEFDQEWENIDILTLSKDCSTDDDKIRSQQQFLMEDIEDDNSDQIASIVSSITPLPTSNAAAAAATATDSPVAIVQGVKMLNMSVTDSLVGRVIGLGGNKINSITRESGAQITVSSRQPRPSENRIITIRGTQKSIDKARELIDEVLSRPDKEYEASKHQLHSSHQKKSSLDMSSTGGHGGNFQQGATWPSSVKRHSTVVPVPKAMGGGMPCQRPIEAVKRTSLPATMKPSATNLEVPLHHFSRSPSPSGSSGIMNRLSPVSLSPHRYSPVDPRTMQEQQAYHVMLSVNNAEFTGEDVGMFGNMRPGRGMYGSSGSLHKTPSPHSVSPRGLSPSAYVSGSPQELAGIPMASSQQHHQQLGGPSMRAIFSPDDMLGGGSDASSSVTIIKSKSVSPQPGYPGEMMNDLGRAEMFNPQYQSETCDHISPGSRESQFGAIGTRRDMRQGMPPSISPQFPTATTAAAFSGNTTGADATSGNQGRRRMSYGKDPLPVNAAL